MKLDWDLIREQLTCIEEERNVFAELPVSPKWTTQTESEFIAEMDKCRAIESRLLGHLEILIDSGFLAGISIHRSADGSLHYSIHSPRLTLQGHELLAEMRSKDLWERIKTTAKNKGIELTVNAVKAIGKVALEKILSE